MQVETYEIEDVSNGEASTMANDAAACELIEKLGLVGQSSLLNKDTLTRVPYRVMEKEEALVYRALNSEECNATDYNLDVIPIRVLQVLEHATSLDFFNKGFKIWYPKANRIDDPVLVGVRDEIPLGRTWATTTCYLLARWGKTLKPYAELKTLAIKELRERSKRKIAECRGKLVIHEQVVNAGDDLEALSSNVYLNL